MDILPKAIHMFNAIPIKIPRKERKVNTKVHMETQETLKQFWTKGVTGNIRISDFKLNYRAIVIKTAWYWHKHRHENQFNRIEYSNTNPHSYSQFLTKEPETCVEERIASSTNDARKTGAPPVRRLTLDSNLLSCIVSTKMDKKPWHKIWNYKTTTRRNGEYTGIYRHKQKLRE
jgi:hypothetical protein